MRYDQLWKLQALFWLLFVALLALLVHLNRQWPR
jgi:hypothetical protein